MCSMLANTTNGILQSYLIFHGHRMSSGYNLAGNFVCMTKQCQISFNFTKIPLTPLKVKKTFAM